MRISVITATRNRPVDIVRLVTSLLESTHPDFEHLIVDQSADNNTRDAVASASGGDRRIRYFHRDVPGKSKAMNFALQKSTGPVVALTDDDCEVKPDWLEAYARLFSETPADIICGQINCAPHDPTQGYMGGFDIGPTHWFPSGWHSIRKLGVGANLAMRRTVFEKVGLFDDMVGPGGIIPSGDDRDFLYRALKKGSRILMAREPVVVHHGFRSWHQDGRDHGRSNGMGLAVPYAKYMRKGDPAAFVCYLRDFLGDARNAAGRIIRWQRPLGINRLRYLIVGVVEGMRYPLDADTMLFRAPDRDRASSMRDTESAAHG